MAARFATVTEEEIRQMNVEATPANFSKASSETFQLQRTITSISDHIRKSFPKISEHFRRFSEN